MEYITATIALTIITITTSLEPNTFKPIVPLIAGILTIVNFILVIKNLKINK